MYSHICMYTWIYQTPPYIHQDIAHQIVFPKKHKAALPACLTQDPLKLQRWFESDLLSKY